MTNNSRKKLTLTEDDDTSTIVQDMVDTPTTSTNTPSAVGEPTVDMCNQQLNAIKQLIIPFSSKLKQLQPHNNERDSMLVRLTYAYLAFSYSLINTCLDCCKTKRSNTTYTLFSLLRQAYNQYKQLK